MKKLFLLFALLAGIAVMTGCKKDQDVVTLQAVVDQDTKAYFGNSDRTLPYWDEGDEVNVNGTDKPLTFPGNTITTIATIAGVDASDYYCAIYPASVVKKMGNPGATTTATIYFDPHQQYIWENNRQRVNMPMGAVTSNDDKTLIFKNLCSILRLKVKNTLATNILVKKLTVTSFGGYISGQFDVTLSASGDPMINASSLNSTEEDNTLTVYVPNKEITRTTDPENPIFVDFDIVVPPFNAEYLILEAELLNTDGSFLGYTSDTVAMASATFTPGPGHSITDEGATTGPVSVPVNKIVTLQFGVNNVTDVIKYDYGYLVRGPLFNQRIRALIGDRTDITTISFNREEGVLVGTHHLYYWDGTCGTTDYQNVYYDTVGNHPAGWVEVQTSDSPHKIWAYIDGTTVKINSWAHFIYANTDSDSMFADLPTISNIQWNTTRDYGFQTEDVTDMSYMFAGDTSLTTITSVYDENNTQDLYFNTTNVTNMAHMFDSCIHLQNLKLSFNTHNVNGARMVAMFKDCPKLGHLDISSFTTDRITDMTKLFYNCGKMADLNISHFNTANVVTKTDMCTGLHNINSNGTTTITCKQSVKEFLLNGTGLNTNVNWNIVQ